MVQVQHLKDSGIERCTLHKAAPLNRTILTAVFVVIYAYTASEMYATMGIYELFYMYTHKIPSIIT